MDIGTETARLKVLYESGRISAAFEVARKLVAIAPDNNDLLILAGGLAIEVHNYSVALQNLQKALDINSNNARGQYLAGVAYSKSGRLADAARHLERAVRIDPDHLESRVNLANVHMRAGKPEQSISAYREIVERWPECSEAHHNLGNLLRSRGDLSDAVVAAEKAVLGNPRDVEALSALGELYVAVSDWRKAEDVHRRLVTLHPDPGDAILRLAQSLERQDRVAEAIEVYTDGLKHLPRDSRIRLQLSKLLHFQKSHNKAKQVIQPLFHMKLSRDAWINARFHYADILDSLGELQKAEDLLKAIIGDSPTTINAYQNLAILKQKKGEIDESINICRQALAYAGDNLGVYDNYLYFLSYHPGTTQKNILEECRAWEKKLKSTLPDWSPEYRGRPDPNRRLRIGYVSPDFIGHVVTYFFNGILENHDRDNFEIHLFANVGKPDASTDYLKSLSDCWHDIFGKTTIRAAETIRDAEIDILIDLAGHTAGNSLPVFALRPAPIQASWIGYANSTGLSEIDYRFTDAIADPPGPDDEFYSEKLVRLRNGFLCYKPAPYLESAGETPASRRGYVTFASFNQSRKLNKVGAGLWAETLNAIPRSRLLLKGLGFESIETRKYFYDMFEDCDLDRHRISIIGPTKSYEDHVKLYSKVDICLDTMPYNGTTTTCEALWMGVPVLTIKGKLHAARVSASILDQIGLHDVLVGRNRDDFIAKAKYLAGNLDILNDMRLGMRARMRDSRLMACELHAREVEQRYRDWWRGYLKNSAGRAAAMGADRPFTL